MSESAPGAPVTRVYGYSDDLCEVEGAITANLPCYSDGGEEWFVCFSDGTVLRLVSDEGIWRLTPLQAGRCGYAHEPAHWNGDEFVHDVVTLTGPLSWVVLGDAMATA